MIQKDRCAIVIKAQPHRSSKYHETVCCAGVGSDGIWRRQYPVPFRILNDSQKFKRWSWISYDYVRSDQDQRRESQKVIPESIEVHQEMKRSERSKILGPLIRGSFKDADSRGESLTILRPLEIDWTWREKSQEEIDDEREKHAQLANQMSLFDETAEPLEPCPYSFHVRWKDPNGQVRNHESDDWESVGAFFNFRRQYGEQKALETLKSKFEDEYFSAGLVLGFSTHKRRNITNNTQNQWLLVGLIRLDEHSQGDLFLG